MAGVEVIGIVAAAGQFIEQTVKVVRLVQEVRSKSRNAPAEIQQWIQEIETLKDIAITVQRTAVLQTPQIEAILQCCGDRSRSLCAILDTISCDEDATFGKKTWSAICGVAQEGKIRALFGDLEREKSSLNAYLANANLLVPTLLPSSASVHYLEYPEWPNTWTEKQRNRAGSSSMTSSTISTPSRCPGMLEPDAWPTCAPAVQIRVTISGASRIERAVC